MFENIVNLKMSAIPFIDLSKFHFDVHVFLLKFETVFESARNSKIAISKYLTYLG